MLIKDKALIHALKTLDALQCRYKVITPEGDEHGELQIAHENKRRNSLYPQGARSSYLRPIMEPLKVGDAIVIPAGEFEASILQHSVCAIAHKLWGASSYRTTLNDQSIELFRIF